MSSRVTNRKVRHSLSWIWFDDRKVIVMYHPYVIYKQFTYLLYNLLNTIIPKYVGRDLYRNDYSGFEDLKRPQFRREGSVHRDVFTKRKTRRRPGV